MSGARIGKRGRRDAMSAATRSHSRFSPREKLVVEDVAEGAMAQVVAQSGHRGNRDVHLVKLQLPALLSQAGEV